MGMAFSRRYTLKESERKEGETIVINDYLMEKAVLRAMSKGKKIPELHDEYLIEGGLFVKGNNSNNSESNGHISLHSETEKGLSELAIHLGLPFI